MGSTSSGDSTSALLSFISAPDYEEPVDSNSDNVYDITDTIDISSNESNFPMSIVVTDQLSLQTQILLLQLL